jgi:hypothetical protein
MIVHFILTSTSDVLRRLVAEFAQGLGCTTLPSAAGAANLRVEVPDGADTLLSLLTYVALSSMKLQLDLREPLCAVTYKHAAEASEVTLTLRIADIALQKTASSV